jgi:hypothetical protein
MPGLSAHLEESKMISSKYPLIAFAIPYFLLATAALAEELPMDTAPTADAVSDTRLTEWQTPKPLEQAPKTLNDKPQNKHMLSDAQLDEERGGQAITIANQSLSAVTQGNVLNGDFTAGNVSISDSALSNFNGVGNILINTGAQVSLQAGMNLTINMTDE